MYSPQFDQVQIAQSALVLKMLAKTKSLPNQKWRSKIVSAASRSAIIPVECNTETKIGVA
jgi:hypothetical protein